MLSHQLLHINKGRSEICTALPLQCQILHVIFQLLLAGNLLICLYLVIALDHMNIDLAEKAFIFTEYPIGFLQEMPHQFSGTGHRSIDHDNKLLDLLCLFPFLRLNKRHISIQRQPIAVKGIVKCILVNLQFLPQNRKLPEKLAVVITRPVLYPQLSQKMSCLF